MLVLKCACLFNAALGKHKNTYQCLNKKSTVTAMISQAIKWMKSKLIPSTQHELFISLDKWRSPGYFPGWAHSLRQHTHWPTTVQCDGGCYSATHLPVIVRWAPGDLQPGHPPHRICPPREKEGVQLEGSGLADLAQSMTLMKKKRHSPWRAP